VKAWEGGGILRKKGVKKIVAEKGSTIERGDFASILGNRKTVIFTRGGGGKSVYEHGLGGSTKRRRRGPTSNQRERVSRESSRGEKEPSSRRTGGEALRRHGD